MRFVTLLVALCFVAASTGTGFCAQDDDSEKSSSGMNPALTGALMGGLLGGGVGAAIGSASGHAGTGALIGAGVGAAGGGLIGANQDKRDATEARPVETPVQPKSAASAKPKKTVIREYDEKGNVISETEVTK